MFYQNVVFPAVCRFGPDDPETVHEWTLTLMNYAGRSDLIRAALRKIFEVKDKRLVVNPFPAHELEFRNPIGVAAGFDKNGLAVPFLGAFGFGHVEVGTVVPQLQKGWPRPRIYRLLKDKGMINRMGFPSRGMFEVDLNLRQIPAGPVILGINVGANKRSVDEGAAINNYIEVVSFLYIHADYITINVSSPNTMGLRDLQGREALTLLLESLLRVRNEREVAHPILVKISPDLSSSQIDDVLEVCLDLDIDGVIATNTTSERPGSLQSPHRDREGGLSGEPLRSWSRRVVAYIYRHTEGEIPIVGVGGVFTDHDVLDLITSGASLVQAYTGFIYVGPFFARNINKGLLGFIEQKGIQKISDVVGAEVH